MNSKNLISDFILNKTIFTFTASLSHPPLQSWIFLLLHLHLQLHHEMLGLHDNRCIHTPASSWYILSYGLIYNSFGFSSVKYCQGDAFLDRDAEFCTTFPREHRCQSQGQRVKSSSQLNFMQPMNACKNNTFNATVHLTQN